MTDQEPIYDVAAYVKAEVARKRKQAYDDLFAAKQALLESEVPMDNRYMWYVKPRWWQFKRRRYLRKLLRTTE